MSGVLVDGNCGWPMKRKWYLIYPFYYARFSKLNHFDTGTVIDLLSLKKLPKWKMIRKNGRKLGSSYSYLEVNC